MKTTPQREKIIQSEPKEEVQETKSSVVENTDLINCLSYMTSQGILKRNKNQIKFESVKEAEEDSKQQIEEAIISRVNFLKEEISEIRKGGFELDFEGLRLLEVPLKIKVWRSTLKKEDLEKILEIFKAVSPRVNELKKANEEREFEKERREKEKEEKEKLKEKGLPKEGEEEKLKDEKSAEITEKEESQVSKKDKVSGAPKKLD